MKLSAGAFQKYTREDTEICLENVVYTQGIYVEIMGIYVLQSNKVIFTQLKWQRYNPVTDCLLVVLWYSQHLYAWML